MISPAPILTWHNVAIATLKGQYFAMTERENKGAPDIVMRTTVDLLEKAIRVLGGSLCERCHTHYDHLIFNEGRLLCEPCYNPPPCPNPSLP